MDDIMDTVILPPPTASNPLPWMSVALQRDSWEQLTNLLLQDPLNHTNNNTTTAAMVGQQQQRQRAPAQVLVFASASIRTLLLRHVLSTSAQQLATATAATTAGAANKKKAPAVPGQDSFPHLSADLNIVATLVLAGGGQIPQQQQLPHNSKYQVVTYFMRPDVHQALLVGQHVEAQLLLDGTTSSSSHNSNKKQQQQLLMHYRIVVVPSATALVRHVFHTRFRRLEQHVQVSFVMANSDSSSYHYEGTSKSDAISSSPTSSIVNNNFTTTTNLQNAGVDIDLVPVDHDVWSMEYPQALAEAVTDQMPAALVSSVARTLVKVQDMVLVASGTRSSTTTAKTIPRLLAFGNLGRAVVSKFMDLQVDEYLHHQGDDDDDDGNVNPGDDDHHVQQDAESSPVAAMIIVDRQVDMVTPLLSPLTYQALLDDALHMDAGFLHVDSDIINPSDDDNDNDKNDKNNNNADHNEKSNNNSDDKKKKKVVALALGTCTAQTHPATTTAGSTAAATAAVAAQDSLFAQVRDQHVEQFGSFLQNQAKVLQASHAAIKDSKKMQNLQEIHQFVRNIPLLQQNLQALTHHIHLAELVQRHSETPLFRQAWQTERASVQGDESPSAVLDVLDDWIAMEISVWKVLRLLCLQSLCGGGIKAGRYDTIRRDIVQTYGYEYLFCLDKLEGIGMLRRREGLWDSTTPASTSNSSSMMGAITAPDAWPTLRKHLHLIHADVDTTTSPDDASYVSSGYAPLSVRLVQAIVKGPLRNEAAAIVKVTDVVTTYPPRVLPKASHNSPATAGPPLQPQGSSSSSSATKKSKKQALLVCYVGGITYMEIAALRFLSKRPSFPFHIVIVTTHITNGVKLLRSMTEPR